MPNGQDVKSDKEKEIYRAVDIDSLNGEINLLSIVNQFEEKIRKELDNRMVSYYSIPHKVFIYVGNYWADKPRVAPHKDI